MKVMYMHYINFHVIIASNIPACNAALDSDTNSVHPSTIHHITRIPCIFEMNFEI